MVIARIKLKRSMESFPPGPPMEDWVTQFSYLLPHSRGILGGVGGEGEGVSVNRSSLETCLARGGLHLGGDVSLSLTAPDTLNKDQVNTAARRTIF